MFAFKMYDRSIFSHSINFLSSKNKNVMEPATGFEPVTSPLPRKCSAN